jgi:hypothetical protein
MFEFLAGLVVGLAIGIGVCAWAVWAVLDHEKIAKK